MKIVLTNVALLVGLIGFIDYILVILLSAIGCCTGMDGLLFRNILFLLAGLSLSMFTFCIINNCRRINRKGK